jgi:hypothetical protein
MSSSNDHIFGVIGVCLIAAVVLGVSAGQVAIVAKHAPQTSALTPVSWTPCEAPRPDVECWHTAGGARVVVCLPLSHNEETE